MSLLQVERVSKSFGGLRALSEVELTVEERSIWGLIGPNGAGKTTLFNIIAGVFRPTSGGIRFEGSDVTRLPAHACVHAGIARTFQNIRLFNNMTVLENVMVGRHCRTRAELLGAISRAKWVRREEREIERSTFAILEFLGLSDRWQERAGSLPYGQQRVLEIGRAIATEARLLLLDEPTAGMTPQEAETLMDVISRIRERGCTILLVEHDMNVVMNVCERISVLHFGEKIAEGTASEIQRNEAVIEAYLGRSRF
ncbi:MAG: ABC transporter ATP-binding protein [Candidatus Methylomirabilia bacterium]